MTRKDRAWGLRLGGICIALGVGCAKTPPPTESPVDTAAAAASGRGAAPSAATEAVAQGPSSVTASSTFSGSDAQRVADGDPKTSWYSAGDDSAAHGNAPFVELALGKPTAVRRVKILGNRDPDYPVDFAILSGKIELFDANRRVLVSQTVAGSGAQHDFDFSPSAPVAGVKSVRFTSLEDEGKKNSYGSVGVAELQVE